MTRRLEPSPKTRGYTLIEMLVVLVLLAMMAGAAWPVLRAPWGKTQVEDAGNQVRVALARARVKAIESGTVWRFRFEPGGSRFAYEPIPARASSAEASRDEADEERIEDLLPHGVRFVDLETLDASPLVDEGGPRDEETDWSQPIIFLPNGRATSARLFLRGAKDVVVEVTLRGLTGAAKVGKPHRMEQDKEEAEEDPST